MLYVLIVLYAVIALAFSGLLWAACVSAKWADAETEKHLNKSL